MARIEPADNLGNPENMRLLPSPSRVSGSGASRNWLTSALFALAGFALLAPAVSRAQSYLPLQVKTASTIGSAGAPMRAIVGIDRQPGVGSRLLCQAQADFESVDWDLCGAGVPMEASPTAIRQLSQQHPDAGRILVATSGGAGIYLSDDFGTSFSGVAVSPTAYVHALVEAPGGTVFAAADRSRLFRSTDGGLSWEFVSSVPRALINGQESDSPTWELAAHPARESVLFARIFNRGVHVSLDGGVTWSSITPDDLLAEDHDWKAAPYELKFGSRGNYLFAASGSGLWRARMTGDPALIPEWQRLPFANIGGSFDVRRLSFSKILAQTAAGTLLVGTLTQGAWMVEDPLDPRHLARIATPEESVVVLEPLTDGGFAVSGPSAGFVSVLAKSAMVGQFPEKTMAPAGVRLRSPEGHQRVFLPVYGNRRELRTPALCNDGAQPPGSAWRLCGRGLPETSWAVDILVSDVVSENGWSTRPRIWVGTWGGYGLYYSDDLGESFSAVWRSEPPFWSSVYDIEQAADGTLFLASSGLVFSSTDEGMNWSKAGSISQLRPPAWKLSTHPSRPEVLYARIPSKGVFWSQDRGATWSALTDESDIQELARRDPRSRVLNGDSYDILFSPFSQEYLFTGSGDGLWRIRLGASGEAVGGWERMQVHALPVNRPPSVPEIRRLRFINQPGSEYDGDLLLGTWGHGVIRLDNPTASSTGAFQQVSHAGEVRALVPLLDDKVIVGIGYEGIQLLELGAAATGLGSLDPAPVVSGGTWNYPNPFSTGTTVTFELSSAAFARLEVFDTLGRIVSLPLDGAFLGPGRQHVRVDGSKLSPGMYFYRLSAQGWTEMHPMVISR